MTNEALVGRIQAGERDLIPALWEQTEKYIALQAGKRARQLEGTRCVTAEDLYQSGFLALVEAVETFRPEAGGSFIGWLAFYLKKAFAAAAGYRTTRRDMLDYSTSLDDAIPGADDLTAADAAEDPAAEAAFEELEHSIWNEQLRAALEDALDSLPENWADALRRKYFQGQTLGEIAAHRGCSLEAVRRSQDNGLNRLRHCGKTRQLQEFVDERTRFYAGVGLGAFRRGGSQPERLTIWREEQLSRLERGGGCPT